MADRDPRDADDQITDDANVEIMEPISLGAMATLARVEIDQQIATAKQYPRNLAAINKELTALVTIDEDTAEECIYALPRGGKTIKGPSARFADSLISLYGNARSGSFVVQVDKDDKFIEAIGMFQDVERNVIRQRRVRRPISGRDGRIYNADMINMTGNAACVIAERNAILTGIPKTLWAGPYNRAFALVAGTVATIGDKLDRAVKQFAVMGLTKEQVLEKLGQPDEKKITPDDIVSLRGMLTALKDGTETPESMFGRGALGHQHETVTNPLKDKPRGSLAQENEADMVVEADGTVSKQKPSGNQTVLDKRFPEANQRFTKFQDWEIAVANYLPPKTTQQASGKAAESGSETPGASGGKAENNAQDRQPDRSSTKGLYTDAESYTAFIHDKLDAATSAAAIKDVWAATRNDRTEFLDTEQIEQLTADKDAKLKSFVAKKAAL